MIRKSVVAAIAVTFACQSEVGEPSRFPVATLHPDLRIGSADARDYFLTWVGDLEVSDIGTIYVMQAMQQTIKVFDSSGVFIRRIGRMGAGPGEFQAPLDMGWVGDTLWAYDGPLTRLSLFDQSGDFVGSVRYGQHGDAALLKDGTVAFRPFSLRGESATALLRLFLDTGEADTIAHITMIPDEGWNPFRDDPLWQVGPGGSYVILVERSTSNARLDPTFQIAKISYTGDTLWHRQYPYRPVPLTEDVISSFVDPVVERRNERSRQRGRPATLTSSDVRADLYIPETLPPVSQLVAGYDNSVWLRREDRRTATPVWDILDADGHRVFSVVVPTEAHILRTTSETVWAVEEDELDIPYVVRYRVTR